MGGGGGAGQVVPATLPSRGESGTARIRCKMAQFRASGSSSAALVAPAALGVGARVALVSPSGPLRDVSELVRAEANAHLFGWETVVGPHAMAREGYFAGTDAQRLADLCAAIADPTIDGIWCLRGGYGAARLLPGLETHTVAAHPKALIGYSDITALHALWRRAGVASFHGPTARGVFTPFTLDSFRKALVQRTNSAGHGADAVVVRDGIATGQLAGGNLALLASLCGTPWACDFTGAIVVLEDINEATYRVDRMLTQLHQSGALAGCAGIVFGHCTNCDEQSDDGSRALVDVLKDFADALEVPTLLGVPVGHIDDQWTLEFGANATLDAANRTLMVAC